MYTEQMELPTPFSPEELDALWFFGLGFYYEHTFWVSKTVLIKHLETHLKYPLTKRVILRAIAKKACKLNADLPGKPLSFAKEEWKKFGRFAFVLHQLVSPRKT